ncbi:MAG: hypothetical protein VCE91_15695, partial [Nitrospinota bacterium]
RKKARWRVGMYGMPQNSWTASAAGRPEFEQYRLEAAEAVACRIFAIAEKNSACWLHSADGISNAGFSSWAN